MKKARIGIIGLGWIGSEHARNILANAKAELAAVVEPNDRNVTSFFKTHGVECRRFKDYRKLLKSDVDAVVIATPNDAHAGMCIEAAAQRKHIYCEKPMAITLEDCRRVRDAVSKSGVQYLIGYHRRLNPLYQHAKGLLDSGKLGRAFMVESDYIHHIPGEWDIWSWLGKEDVAGSLFHAGSGHNVDLIRYFCGDVTEVACFKDVFLPRKEQVETEDTAVAIYRFESGAIGKVQCCVGPIVPFTFNLRLYGTRGTVINNRVWFDTIPRYDQPGHEKECVELPESWIPDNVQGGISETWNKLMDHFIDMLTADAKCLNDVESAYRTSVACFGAVRSAQERRVIDLKKLG